MKVWYTSSSAIEERISGSARWAITRRAIFTVTAGAAAIASAISRAVASSSSGGTTRDTMPWPSASSAVRRRPVSTMSLTRPGPAIWKSRPTPPVSGITPWPTSGSMKRAALRRDADVAEQRPLERAADGPAVERHDHRRREVEELLDPDVAAGHQLVVRHRLVPGADRADVAARRPRLALAAPDHRPHVGPLLQLAEDLEEPLVHRVVEGVVLLDVVVGDRGDRAIDVEPHTRIGRA